MRCESEITELVSRGEQICAMLRPLTGRARLAQAARQNPRELLIAVHSGARPDTSPTDWRFTTITTGVRASYHERWLPSDETKKRYYLERAYLHLYRRLDGARETEILALHCDPNEPDDAGLLRHALYKRGPHIHVKGAPQPLPHSHIALNVGELPTVLSSAVSLSAAMASGILMIRDQVLDIIDHRGF